MTATSPTRRGAATAGRSQAWSARGWTGTWDAWTTVARLRRSLGRPRSTPRPPLRLARVHRRDRPQWDDDHRSVDLAPFQVRDDSHRGSAPLLPERPAPGSQRRRGPRGLHGADAG